MRWPDRMWRLKWIGFCSGHGRWRSREQAATTTATAHELLGDVAFFVEDMECRQANVADFLITQCHLLTDRSRWRR
jgi:hypothetical protein